MAADSDIVLAIRKSGLSPDELRNRLREAGYDTKIAQPWLGALSDREVQGVPPASTSQRTTFSTALCNLGIIGGPEENAEPDSSAEISQLDTADIAESRQGINSRVFGKSLFGRRTNLFDPVTTGPVDPSYRVGPGDRLQLVLTGDVEDAYQIEIRGDGTVVLPQIGQVGVGGLTLDGARAVLRKRAASAYSSVGSGRTNLDLTVARLRSNVVFVTGEVERPGAYQVNSLSTVFHALTKSGGPTARGSFRNVELRRAGAVIQKLDVYEYLLRGDASTDLRTEQGDIIFVPLNTRSVELKGAVRRPAIFELKQAEGFADLIRFAGGLLPTAAVDRVQVDRILAARERTPGHERAILDIRIDGNLDSLSSLPLNDADAITVFSIGDLRRNEVTVTGAVFRPGVYQFTPQMNLDSLIRAARGFQTWALVDRVKVSRPLPETGRSEIVSLDYNSPAARSFRLQEFDEVTVLDGRDVFPAGSIIVSGAVNRPGKMPYAEGQTLQDVIDLSRGLREDAASLEVSTTRRGRDYSDTTSIVTRFQVNGQGRLEPNASGFTLSRDDRVFVRAAPGFRPQRFVEISGLVKYPGAYALTANRDRLLDLIDRAGGLLPTAYPENFVFLRDGRTVAIALAAALKGDRDQNIALEGGDKIVIGPTSNTVYVTGSVEHPSLVLYQPGRSLREYLQLAGGASLIADVGRSRVTYPSGSTLSVRRRFLMPDQIPDVLPGSTITVPAKPAAKEGQFTQNFTTFAQIASTFASLAIAYIAIVRR